MFGQVSLINVINSLPDFTATGVSYCMLFYNQMNRFLYLFSESGKL